MKRSILRRELLRRLRLIDEYKDSRDTVKDLYFKLINRDYPKKIILKEISHINFEDRYNLKERLARKIQAIQKSAIFPFQGYTTTTPKNLTIPMIIQNDPRSLRIIKKSRKDIETTINEILKNKGFNLDNVRVVLALRVGKTLRKILQQGTKPKY